MSDSVSKWHEMQEDKLIFESPDGGKTVTSRPFGGDVNDKTIVQQPEISKEVKRDAYTILSVYSEDSIRLAAKILDVGK